MELNFLKMVASGNDFILIDGRDGKVENYSELARRVCARRYSIGADGLIVIEEDADADFRMRIFNPDGSEPEMCGNGARCAVRFAQRLGIVERTAKFQTLAGLQEAQIEDGRVNLKLADPKDLQLDVEIELGHEVVTAHFINTGVPHAVLIVDDVKGVDVVELGRAIRWHEKFQPAGTNVDFVSRCDKVSIFMRTYERGVEDETLACGTGAVASAIVAYLKGIVEESKVCVRTRGGTILAVRFEVKGGSVKDVWLEGDAEFVYEGKIII